jgi:hypothetical protein
MVHACRLMPKEVWAQCDVRRLHPEAIRSELERLERQMQEDKIAVR